METDHRIFIGDSRQMSHINDGEVDLVITSPPYPLVKMWDTVFSKMNPAIGDYLEHGAGNNAFELMHRELSKTWAEVDRVLADEGIVCINIGDATRKIDGTFQLYPNHVEIIDWFTNHGFQALPDILWRKPTNSAAKFMGSGMLPPNAYVTLEHEYILIFRKNDKRSFEPGSKRRYQASYFWEERNNWFSDLWENVIGENQILEEDNPRKRSGAFPLKIPYRLINMYSVYDDTILDPFWGTGTTSLAAMVAGRNSLGYELENNFKSVFEDRIDNIKELSQTIVSRRINDHFDFIKKQEEKGEKLDYRATNYAFPVKTKQEKEIQFCVVTDWEQSDGKYQVLYEKLEGQRNLSNFTDIPINILSDPKDD